MGDGSVHGEKDKFKLRFSSQFMRTAFSRKASLAAVGAALKRPRHAIYRCFAAQADRF